MQKKTIKLEAVPGIHAGLSALASFRLPFKKALALSKLCGRFSELQRVYFQQLNALAQEHGTKFLPDGSFHMPQDAGQCQALCDALNGLVAEETEIAFEPVGIGAADIGEQKIGAADILALDGIVAFF
jgi:hypothetical protein